MPQKIVRVPAGPGDEDGESRNSGFVSFPQLWCTAQYTQILHDRVHFAFEVTNSPLPSISRKIIKLVLLLQILYG